MRSLGWTDGFCLTEGVDCKLEDELFKLGRGVTWVDWFCSRETGLLECANKIHPVKKLKTDATLIQRRKPIFVVFKISSSYQSTISLRNIDQAVTLDLYQALPLQLSQEILILLELIVTLGQLL